MTMTNAEWMIQQGYKFSDVHVWYSCSKSDEFVVRIKEKKIDTFKSKLEFPGTDEAFVEWLDMEHKEPILTDDEKRYLNGVINPFRDEIQVIAKHSSMAIGKEYLLITATNCAMPFPNFDTGTMYKGMKLDHAYAPKELGL